METLNTMKLKLRICKPLQVLQIALAIDFIWLKESADEYLENNNCVITKTIIV